MGRFAYFVAWFTDTNRGVMVKSQNQGIVGCTPTNVPLWEIPILGLYSGYLWVSYPQESLENTINTMGTLLGVHPIVP